jgi:hypothetical protein
MFHVTHHRAVVAIFAAFVLFLISFASHPAPAEASDQEMAERIATLLGEKFSPESLIVTVKESRAYAEMTGAVLSGIRIDAMRLDALLAGGDALAVEDVDSLASLIGYSKGEIVLLEKDVNAYFDNNDTRGFSNLKFDFTPGCFKADGIFSADFIFRLRIRLSAEGVLALESDGLYLDDVSIYVEKMIQPSALTQQIVSRVNPLLEWSDIPFKVEFKTVAIDDDAAIMTGNPQKIENGGRAFWPSAK